MSKHLVYDTTLEIDLENLVANYHYFKSLVPENTKMMVMVKAFSYGLGTYEVAQELEKEGVDYLGVANILEGLEIRKEGVKTPIMVMNPEAASFDLMIKHDLSPVLFSVNTISSFAQEVKRLAPSHPINIHVKIDTGMHRLGASMGDLEELVAVIQNYSSLVQVASIFSHLAATDEAEHDSFTHQQATKFKAAATEFKSHFDYPIDEHLLNTNGIIRFPEYAMDMVRLGIGLYGVCNDANAQQHLKTVSTLKTKISHLINVPKGETIGYGRHGVADQETTIATIPMGYADGFNRLLSNGKWEVLIHGKKAPVIGNISMDMATIDVTGIDCKLGDEVIVFGEDNPIWDMAKRINTIPYELFTIISPRVKRVFLKH